MTGLMCSYPNVSQSILSQKVSLKLEKPDKDRLLWAIYELRNDVNIYISF